MEFEQYHWVSKKSDQIRPRTIISKAKKFKDKQKIGKNGNYMKDIGIYIYEDFCMDAMELWKKL